jgi:hypothetical protein
MSLTGVRGTSAFLLLNMGCIIAFRWDLGKDEGIDCKVELIGNVEQE